MTMTRVRDAATAANQTSTCLLGCDWQIQYLMMETKETHWTASQCGLVRHFSLLATRLLLSDHRSRELVPIFLEIEDVGGCQY